MTTEAVTQKIVKDLIKLREDWRKNPDYLCFWSSPDNPCGLRLTPTIESGKIYVDMAIEKHHSGFPGISHGGVPFTILDGIMSWYLMSHFGRAGFTKNASVRYMKPLFVGAHYRFQVTFVSDNAKLGTVSLLGEVFDLGPSSKNRPLLSMTGDFVLPPRKIAESILGSSLIAASGDLFPEQ